MLRFRPQHLFATLILLITFNTAHASNCTLKSAQPSLEFGTYQSQAHYYHRQTIAITVTCVATTAGTINYTLTTGTTPAAAHNIHPHSPRQLKHPHNLTNGLYYNLYTTNGKTRLNKKTRVIIGQLVFIQPGTQQAVHVLYGEIPPAQTALSGTYRDNLTIQLEYD